MLNTILLRPAPITSWEYIVLEDAPKPLFRNKHHFLYLDREVIMECPLIDHLVNAVLTKCQAELGVLFYNFHLAQISSRQNDVNNVHIAVSLRREWFKRPPSYLKLQHLSYARTQRVLDYLELHGFIKVLHGYWNIKYSHGLRTLVLPLPKFYSALYANPSSVQFKVPKRTGRIILKDQNKVPVRLPSTKKTSDLSNNLRQINYNNARHCFYIVRSRNFSG